MIHYNIAIDGPSGAGKSTIARSVAKELGILYVDTGAMYRTIGLYALRKGTDTKDESAISKLLPEIGIDIEYAENGEQRMFLNGEDVSGDIRLPEVSIATANVSAHSSVRRFLLETQRSMAATHSVVMDGRDIGTVILPDARIKIFLTASQEERALRRHRELLERGVDVKYRDVLDDIAARDKSDTARAVAPLKAAEDAIVVDTTGLTLEESIKHILELCKERLKDGLEEQIL